MSALGSLYFKLETLEELVKVVKAKGDKGLEITISISDESNQYGQNISSYVSQSKEQRDEGKKKYFTANGNIFWENGKIVKGARPSDTPHPAQATVSNTNDDPLPF